MKKANGDKVGYLASGAEDIWVYALPESNYTFHFSVHTKDGRVVKIQAREIEWITDHAADFEYVKPPDFVRDVVKERVEIVVDPNALAILEDNCVRCQKEYLVDVTPKIDLLIDGRYAQRVIKEYCPDCDQPLIQRKTFQPPKQYAAEFHNDNAPPEHRFDLEEVDISSYTWEHARQ
ncbi:hypothetical protein [Halobellus inordinatus]|uniref:hypothetical protein n=1 Tax=Halobellus inordinatus TaxID=1126236 RepID=UPI002114077E|nr:hypothetical protein [Halobellus ramosii]